jgi:hypothetical protein
LGEVEPQGVHHVPGTPVRSSPAAHSVMKRRDTSRSPRRAA